MIATERKGTYNTFNKIRFALFTYSYAGYSISNVLRKKYKINDKLTVKELREQFGNKRLIPEISRLSKTLNLNYKALWKFIVLTKTPRIVWKLNDKDKVKAYLGIESEITTLIVGRQDKDSLIEEEYNRAILTPAIERAAGDSLSDIEDDNIFNTQLEELQRKYKNWYYATAYKYKLPTPRIISFILRLIN